MRKLKITIIGILVLCSYLLEAQDFPYHYFSHINPLVTNPSFAAMKSKMEANVASHNMWAGGFKPLNDYQISFSIAPDFKKNKRKRNYQPNVGIGILFLNEQIGPFNKNILHLVYSYHIPIDRKNMLSLGLSGIVENIGININSLSSLESNDPRLLTGNNNSFLIDGGFGATIHSESYQFGFSVINLAPGIFQFDNTSASDLPNYRKYYFTGNYIFQLGEILKVQPAISIRNSRFSIFNYDPSITFDFSFTSFGFGYRSEKSLFIYTHIPFKQFVFSYTSENAFASKYMIGNAHTFSIGWNLK